MKIAVGLSMLQLTNRKAIAARDRDGDLMMRVQGDVHPHRRRGFKGEYVLRMRGSQVVEWLPDVGERVMKKVW